MAGATGLGFARHLWLAAAAGLALSASSARAIEALDGRVQFHGFTEMQLRALDEKFAEELDLAQWYNVLNLELEFDIAPDGIGPIDLLSAYVRVEGRYDAVYSEGFYLFPSVNTFGDEAENLPKRLRDSKDREMAGVIRATDRFGDFKSPRIIDRDPTALVPPVQRIQANNLTPFSLAVQFPDGLNVAAGGLDALPESGRQSAKGERRGFPGFDTFFRQAGPDDQFGTADDPAAYVHAHAADFAFTFREIRGPIGNDTLVMGPWLPKNFIRANALNTDRGNPFRGRVAPTPPMRLDLGIFATDQFGTANPTAIRYHAALLENGTLTGDPFLNPAALLSTIPVGGSVAVDLLDPLMVRILTAPDNVLLDLRGWSRIAGGAIPARLNETFPGRFIVNPFSTTGLSPSPALTDDYGGDFMGGIVPCLDPTEPTGSVPIRNGTLSASPGSRCIESSSTGGGPGPGSTGQTGGTPGNPPNVDPGDPKGSYTPSGLVKMPGGFTERVALGPTGLLTLSGNRGETPFRPAPDLPNLGQRLIGRSATNQLVDLGPVENLNSDLTQAQGLYVPSKGTIRELQSDHLDSLQFNYDEVDRAWNRGQSQENNKELKEAYFDVEVLDSRLWMRLGLQNIVWGKTELFRTTDQFNPQDLALASLPSLEESRIALWSARFVYSLYDVGVLEDVRLEFAANIDQYQPSDLGACGEPFTPDLVCTLTAGIFAHSLLGLGVVGIDRPEAPWKDLSDLEFGGRIEWRWDRFSFALMDFWGFSDFPNTESTYYYERNVDTLTGRPLVGRLPSQQPGKCGLRAGENAADGLNAGGLRYNSSFASHPFSVTPGAPEFDGAIPGFTRLRRGGVGFDPDCLRPGGAPGLPNAFAFDQETLAETNALQNHHANQQIFAWICAGTVGIAAALDAGSCAWTIFATDAVLQRQVLPISFVESLTAMMAGEQTGEAGPQQFMGLIANNTKGAELGASLSPTPLASMNMLFNNPLNPFDRNLDGDRTDTVDCATSFDPLDPSKPNPNCDLGGFDGFDGRVQIPGRLPVGASSFIVNFISLDKSLTNEQRALIGCGPFYATRCDSSLEFRAANNSLFFGNFGGLDFMNTEASVLVQSWPGIEGSFEGMTTTSRDIQPGTVGWVPSVVNGGLEGGIGGPICTRFVMDSDQMVKLPGCRGVRTLQMTTVGGAPRVIVEFEEGYLPSIDGCVIGTRINRPGNTPVEVELAGASQLNAQLRAELALCNGATTKKVVPNRLFTDTNNDGTPDVIPVGFPGAGQPITAPNPACIGSAIGAGTDEQGLRVCNSLTVTLEDLPLLHPTAGCVAPDPDQITRGHFPVFGASDCRYWMYRDLVQEFFDGSAQLFQNELAAFSWNFLMFLTLTSCNLRSFDLDGNDHRLTNNGPRDLSGDPQCFDPGLSYAKDRCSIAAPHYCTNVKGFLTAAGVTRNTALAGGSSRFGRRTFIWHSGGELVLDYEQRNVLGLSSDFAEDVTKTNWGVEFTWIEGVPFSNNDSLVGLSDTDVLNLTVSIDRPTFINFLNPNRTFFFNTQWFFNYLTDYEDGYTFNGPWNVLFTFAMFTGYFQDRVQPQFVTVYDFRSQSGGLLPSFQYRFTESFSVTIGMLYFFGRTELKDMPVREYGPAANRSGQNAYETGVDNLLSLIRQRDEVFMRLRWTF